LNAASSKGDLLTACQFFSVAGAVMLFSLGASFNAPSSLREESWNLRSEMLTKVKKNCSWNSSTSNNLILVHQQHPVLTFYFLQDSVDPQLMMSALGFWWINRSEISCFFFNAWK